ACQLILLISHDLGCRQVFLCFPVTQLWDSLSQVGRGPGRKTASGTRNPGTDGTASEFPAEGAGNPWQSRQSRVSALARAHDEHRHVQMMPYGTDGGAEDQVLQSAVAVRAHDHQVGVDLLGVTQDFLGGGDRMGDRGDHANPLIAQGLGDAFEVLAAQLHLRRGGRCPYTWLVTPSSTWSR